MSRWALASPKVQAVVSRRGEERIAIGFQVTRQSLIGPNGRRVIADQARARQVQDVPTCVIMSRAEEITPDKSKHTEHRQSRDNLGDPDSARVPCNDLTANYLGNGRRPQSIGETKGAEYRKHAGRDRPLRARDGIGLK